MSPKHCKNLEEYIKKAFQLCGWKVFSSVFFGDPAFLEEDYTISLLQLKRSKYEKEVEQAQQKFQQHMTEKSHIEDANKLMNWYEQCNDLLSNVQEVEKKLLEFDCEPFEELRFVCANV